MLLPIGAPLQVNVNGAQRTTFFPTVEATAKRFNLAIVPDPKPSAGSYYRSDHFSLSRVGIPAFSIETGHLYESHDDAWGKKQHQDFTDHDYHNFSDNYHADWDFTGNAKLRPLRHGSRLAGPHRPHHVQLAPQRTIRASPQSQPRHKITDKTRRKDPASSRTLLC
jgi:Zn-dependent M28 family amino/carboxypeptidase